MLQRIGFGRDIQRATNRDNRTAELVSRTVRSIFVKPGASLAA